MRYRTIIIEDEEAIRNLLVISASLRSHEVFSFPTPVSCSLSREDPCPCEPGHSCADILITDHMMQDMTGLELLELLERKQCLIPNKAVVTAADSKHVFRQAKRLGCTLFRKPFQVSEISTWLENSEGNVREGRQLRPKEEILIC